MYRLSDSEKFRVIIEKYYYEFRTEEKLILNLGVDEDIFNSWKEDNLEINREHQRKISKVFNIKNTFWKKDFLSKANLLSNIEKYKIIDHDDNETDGELSDTQKFKVIYTKYNDECGNQITLSRDTGITRSSISSWMNTKRAIEVVNRKKIEKKFRLNNEVWKKVFYTEKDLEEDLDYYRIDADKYEIVNACADLDFEDEVLIEELYSQDKIDFENYIDNKSKSFLYNLAELLERRSKVHDAIEVLNILDKGRDTIDTNCLNKIEHLKAKLYSHENIEDWDKAIGILDKLKIKGYDKLVAEINTLYASNMKRRTLSDFSKSKSWKPKEDVDLFYLSVASTAYYDEYKKKNPDQYYNAINHAYLVRIYEHLSRKKKEDINLKEIHKGLWHTYSLNTSNWWQVTSDAEFLMLLGETTLANSKINDFFEENHKLTQSEIEPTFRQLELYIHFTDDNNAKQFYDNLKECWSYYNS